MTNRRTARGEEGAVLALALVFLTFFAILIGALLVLTQANFKMTGVVTSHTGKLYAADGGIDYGIQQMRASSTLCQDAAAGTQAVGDVAINGRTVHVTCQTLSGSPGGGTSPGGATLAVVATGYNGPTGAAAPLATLIRSTGNQAGNQFFITGGAFNAGSFSWAANSFTTHFQGDVHQYDPYCTNAKNSATTLDNPVMDAPSTWVCENAAGYPIPDPNPSLIVPTAAAPAPWNVNATCRVFFPGKYTSPLPAFSSSNRYYFASGVYYFENVGAIALGGQVFGGAQGTETKKLTPTPCSTDAAANGQVPGSATGSGVEFVLGGTSRITVNSSSSENVELFSRVPLVPAAEGKPGVSIYAPRSNGTNYVRWNTGVATDRAVVFTAPGNDTSAKIVFHGLVYVPTSLQQTFEIHNPGNPAPSVFSGGLVCQALTISVGNNSQSGSVPVAQIVVPSPPTPRTVVITATAPGTQPGETSIVSKSVIVIDVDGNKTTTVQSWRVQ